MENEKLNNPTYYSLSETHNDIAIVYGDTKFYQPAYCPFGGSIDMKTIASAADAYALLTGHFFIVGDKPTLNDHLRINKELLCNQMILAKPIDIAITENIVPLQSEAQKKELFDLINLVQPGYFRPKTTELGNYYGIYQDDMLIAVTGERMKMNAYTEVSAVVTHPAHTGKGYAKQLIAHTCNKIVEEKKTPYLHVVESNVAAIGLYEKLGFYTRRKISFWDIEAI